MMKFDCNIAEMEAVELPGLAAKTSSEIDCKRAIVSKSSLCALLFTARCNNRDDEALKLSVAKSS
jgi:hypothetical protein